MSQGIERKAEAWFLLDLFPYINSFQICLCPHTTNMYTKVYIPFLGPYPASSNFSFMSSLKLSPFLHMTAINLFSYFIFDLFNCFMTKSYRMCVPAYHYSITWIELQHQYYLGLNYKTPKENAQKFKRCRYKSVSRFREGLIQGVYAVCSCIILPTASKIKVSHL